MKKTIIITCIAALGFAGCKYEEGPSISLTPKKERMENTWDIVSASDEGEDVSDSYDNYTLVLAKDGDATLTAKYSYGPFSYTGTTNGTWEFKNNKEDVSFDFEDDDADQDYQILKLTTDELWLREKGGDLELKLN